ncbi:MAG: glycosyltransferase [Pseudomonadota bacterium]
MYVQHLLGIGHLRRAAVLSKALAGRGLRVVFVSGGCPVPHLDCGDVDFVQLPPIKSADESFALLGEDGRPIDEPFKSARRDQLLDLYERVRPRALMIELFPFGRRQVRFELLPLLEKARDDRPKPKVFCSLRDILTRQKSPEKVQWMLDCFNRFFDGAIVHGDPRLIRLEESFPVARDLQAKLHYSGFVIEIPAVDPQITPTGEVPSGEVPSGEVPSSEVTSSEVIVSAGGGAVAGPLLAASLEARALSPLATAPWRFLVGHNYPEVDFLQLMAKAPEGVIVERARPDFHQLLTAGQLSISQGGYNTVMELMALGVPSVVVPFAAGVESEQSLRCERLAERGLLTVVAEASLTPRTLADGIEQCLARQRDRQEHALSLNWDGATQTAALVAREIAGEG